MKSSAMTLLCSVVLMSCLVGCSASGPSGPKIRLSPYFGSDINYLNPENLGEYCYGGCFSEKIGMIYTAKAGFIDTGHLIESVDRTKYISGIAFENLRIGNEEFSFDLVEPARYFVGVAYPSISVKYPANWIFLNADEKEKIAKEISIDLGQYISYSSTIWHEIITWFGYSCVAIFPETPSSFSWEDLYSDLLGTRICARALQEKNGNFNETVTRIINEEIKKLDAQKPEIAKQATRKIEGKWFSGSVYPFIRMMKRNFDVGIDNGCITPWLVPGICKNNIPELLPVPKIPSKQGFSFKIELEPRGPQGDRVLGIVYPNKRGKRIQPDAHYPKIMEYIRNQAIMQEGIGVDKPNL